MWHAECGCCRCWATKRDRVPHKQVRDGVLMPEAGAVLSEEVRDDKRITLSVTADERLEQTSAAKCEHPSVTGIRLLGMQQPFQCPSDSASVDDPRRPNTVHPQRRLGALVRRRAGGRTWLHPAGTVSCCFNAPLQLGCQCDNARHRFHRRRRGTGALPPPDLGP